MSRKSLGLVLALAVLGGCATQRGALPEEPASQPAVGDKFAERLGYGVRGAALGALYGVATAVSIAEGDPKGTMYVSYVTVPLFAFAGLGSGLTNGAADPMRFPMLPIRGGFRSRK
jgi:hypothetical protein